MGFGNLFKSGPSSFTTNVAADEASANAAIAQNQQTQAAANAASAAQRNTVSANVAQSMDNVVGANAAGRAASTLGILDYIRTSTSGLSNQKANTGRLTILGN